MVKKNPEVFAVIATFNRKELLREVINALTNQKYNNLKVMIADNASADGTYDYIKDLIDNKKTFYIKLEKNLGASGGFNAAIREAYKQKPDYFWILDDDTVVHDNSLQILIKYAENLDNKFGFLGSKVLWKNGEICKMNIPRKTPFRSNTNFKDQLVPVVTSSFVSMLVKTSTVEELGLPIADFFIWTDDWEYTRRISKKYPSYLVNESIVTHKCPSNNGSNIVSDSEDRLWRYEYAFRNEGYYYKREGILGYMYLLLRQFYYIPKIIFSKKKGKIKKIKLIFKCTWRAFKFNPEKEFLSKGE